MTGGFRHSSIVVQIENDGREVVAVDDQVRAVADADLVDLAEQVVGGVAGEDVRQPRLDPHPDEGQPTGLGPGTRLLELGIAELDAALRVRPLGVRLRERHRHVEVVGAGRQRPVEDGHDEARVDRVEDVGDAVLAGEGRDIVGARGVDAGGDEPRVAILPGDRALGARRVVVGDDHRLEEVALRGDRDDRAADAAGAHDEDPHRVPPVQIGLGGLVCPGPRATRSPVPSAAARRGGGADPISRAWPARTSAR